VYSANRLFQSQAFFRFRLADVPQEDIDFLMRRYFPDQTFRRRPVRQAEYYMQRKEFCGCSATARGRKSSCRCSRKEPLNESGAV